MSSNSQSGCSMCKYQNDVAIILGFLFEFVNYYTSMSISKSYRLEPGYPKLMMTSQFPQKSEHRTFPGLEPQKYGKWGKGKRNYVFFKQVTFPRTELHLCFPLFSLLELLMQRSLDPNYSWEILTSQMVFYHLEYIKPIGKQ